MAIQFNKVTWYSKLAAVIIFLILIPGLAFYFGRQFKAINSAAPETKKSTTGVTTKAKVPAEIPSTAFLNGTYDLDGENVTLVNGKAEQHAGPDSVSKIETSVFGKPVQEDLNGDGQKDAIFFISQETGGTGIFFFVVAAVNDGGKYTGTNSIFLGDRITPKNIIVTNGVAQVNYSVRKDSDPMTATPSVVVTKYLKIKNGSLVEVGGK